MATGNEVVSRTTVIPVTFSKGVSNNVLDASEYTHLVRRGDTSVASYVAYETLLNSNTKMLLFGTSGGVTVTNVSLEFWHHEADMTTPIKDLSFVALATDQPSTRNGVQLEGDISGATAYLTQEIHGIRKTKETVVLGTGVTAAACIDFTARLLNVSPWIAVGMRRPTYTGDADITGDVDIGGVDLADDTGSEWRDKDDTSNNVIGSPKFIITWQRTIAGTALGRTETRYTTMDPTTIQSTPNSSIGGFVASNEIYTSGQISQSVNSSQTTIDLADSATIPEPSGLAQLGAEIFRYNSTDDTNKTLLGITRGISPGYSFPAGLQPFSEYVYFLEIDNLFNTKPTTGMNQYRCVGITNTGFDVQNVRISLRQSAEQSVQADVGIEVPLYNYRTATLAANVTSDTVITSTTTTVTEYDGSLLAVTSSLFDGGYITIGSTVVEILSFATDATTATFVIDQAITGTAGDTFTIHSAPSQRISNDSESPTQNSNRFFGFLSEGGSDLISYNGIKEGGINFLSNEEFYVWIKRSLVANVKSDDNTGAVLIIRFDPI